MSKPLDFDRMITEGAKFWQSDLRRLDAAEKFVRSAATDRQLFVLAQVARQRVRAEQASLRSYLRERFGVELLDSISEARLRVVDEKRRRPRTLAEVAHRYDVVLSLMTCNIASWAMMYANRQAATAYLAKVIVARWWATKRYGVIMPILPISSLPKAELSAYFYIRRNAPIVYAPLARSGEGPPARRLEEAAAGALAAWVRARIKMYASLRKALAKVGSPQEVLQQELPAAVLAELAELDAALSDPEQRAELVEKLGKGGVYRVLTNRVSKHLRASAGECNDLPDDDMLEDPEAVSSFGDFELRETVRRQLDALEQGARFSPQETEVWRRIRVGKEIEQIAAELGIPKEQVSVVAYNTRKKAREARKAAGL